MKTYIKHLTLASSLLCVHSVWANIASQCQTDFNIIHFVPDSTDVGFWKQFTLASTAAAQDLQLNYQVISLPKNTRNRYVFVNAIQQKLAQSPKPDLVIGYFYLHGEVSILRFFEQKQIPFISVNTSLPTATILQTGQPREKFTYWLAHISPDDTNAGYQLAQYLIRDDTSNNTIAVIAGQAQSMVSENRIKGLTNYSQQHAISLLPTIHVDWSAVNGYSVTQKILSRVKETNIIWTAAASIGVGSAEAIQELPTEQQNNITIGSFDWTPQAIEAIKTKQISVSYGGHFLEGAWALVLALDYLNGLDFVDETGSTITTRLHPLTQDNLTQVSELVTGNGWNKNDFKKLSKCFNPSLVHYNFNVQSLLKQR
ncbi:ABC transporter substrate-binding protein [Catenovulum agarivorans]|uniref:ABC transporter substrate-binding protein n=1 Tax=Catenovulum agarivorans TaxID=1172192 RepID=UPI00136486C4|nr:ABC transporter substrate-binding protein [Catenovulum agarivorans]